MRWQFKVMIVMVLAVAALEITQGQAQQFGGGFPAFGKGGQTNPLTLLAMPAVKMEIKLTEDQTAKVNEAVWAGLSKVLDADQLKRLRQIELQQKDYMAFTDPYVQKELKLNDDQKARLKEIVDDTAKEMIDLGKSFGGGGGKGKGAAAGGGGEKITSLMKETNVKCMSVLTKEQKRTWNEMLGEKFEMPAFGKGKKDGQ
jgi:hypothetical protein